VGYGAAGLTGRWQCYQIHWAMHAVFYARCDAVDKRWRHMFAGLDFAGIVALGGCSEGGVVECG
jgi:hypothetical protein